MRVANMQKQRVTGFCVTVLALFLVLAACRKEEPEAVPTAVPTAVVPDVGDQETREVVSVADTPTPRPNATATTEAEPVAAVNADEIDWPPQVIYSSPQPGEETSLDGAITIRFDQPMDQPSVEAAFQVQALTAEEELVEGTFAWPRPDTLLFTPDQKLKRRQAYRVNLGEQASSAKGFTLREPLDFYLQTIGSLEVSQVLPANGVREVQTDSAITVLFNRPVVPLAGGRQQAEFPQPLILDPPASGQGEWVSTSIYRFVPDQPLAGATAYQAQVTAGLADFAGGVLEDDFVWRFATLAPTVNSIQPENGHTDFDPARPVTVTFNMPMNRASAEAAISIRSAAAPAVDLDYIWSEADRVVTLVPRQPLRLATSYQVGIAQSARSASGEASLEGDVLSGFTTVPLPAVVSTRPGRDSQADRWQRGVSIDFASAMDWSTLEGRVRIEPDPGEVEYYFFDAQLNIDFELERNTAYVITVPGNATDPYGNSLGADYTWRFSTPGSDPVASLNLPQRISQISTSFVTKVDIIHRNISRLDVALYDLGLPLNLINEPYSVTDYRPAATPLRTWDLPLDTPREQVGVLPLSLADGGTLATGIYLLSIDAPEADPDSRFWQNQQHTLIVADTNIVVKEMFGEIRVWVTDIASGEPAAGYDLVAYNRRGAQLGSAVSDANGFAMLQNPPDDYLAGITVVSGRPGESGFGIGQSIWNEGVTPWQFGLDVNSGPELPTFAYLYTDRPIYRPGDTVYYKGIVRNANYGRYGPPLVESLEIQVASASFFSEDTLDETITVSLDQSGSFSGEYALPEDLNLGTYRFSVRGTDFSTERRFTVAEYRKPEFSVELVPDLEEVVRGQAVNVVLQASYFFGGPATDLEVNWSVYEDEYRLEVPGPFYSFSDQANFYYESSRFFGDGGDGLGTYLIGGNGRTDGSGQLRISLPADLLADVKAGSRTVTVEASVSDLANFPVSSRGTVIMHAAETYVGTAVSDYLVRAGISAEVALFTVDWTGVAVPNQDVEVVFYQREWKRERRSELGGYVTLWEPIDTEVDRVQVVTNNQGKTTAAFVPEEGGIYLAVATVRDRAGRTHTSSLNFWVIDSRYIGWRTDPQAKRMDLVPDKQAYRPGEVARVLVQSPFTGPVQAWLTIERGKLIEQRLVTLQSSSELLEIPVTPEMAPNVFLSLTAVKGVAPDDIDNPYADIRLGITELIVSPEQLELNLRLMPREERFSPGDTAVYDILVTDYQDNPVQAELSLALVDLAVLTLKEDNAPPILEAFYARQPYRSQVGSGLFISGEGLEVEVPVEALGRGGGGGGGVADLALVGQVDQEEDEVRGDFPDTAYWKAVINTGRDGQAAVEIPLPDSLTTWRLSSKAVSHNAADTLVGQSQVDVIVTLPLLLRPVTPRFFTVGDVLQLGTIVNNNTDESIEATVSLQAQGLTLHSATEQDVTVPAGGRQLVRWQAVVNDVEFVDLTFRAEGGGYQDATKPTFGEGADNLIPVYRYDARDLAGTSGVLTEAGRRVEAVLLPPGVDTRQGALHVNLSPSLVSAMLEAVDYVDEQAYLPVCAHAVTDRLLPNVAAAVALQELGLGEPELKARLDQQVQAGLQQLENLVKPDGGWGWCYSEQSNEWLTAYALLALTKAAGADFAVAEPLIRGATAYLQGALALPSDLNQPFEVNRQAFFIYVLAEAGNNMSSDLDNLMAARRALLDPYARALMALAYELAGNRGNNQLALVADLNDSVILSAAGAHWQDASQDFDNLSSNVRGTAMIIDALTGIDPDNVLLPQAVRWLMVGRQAQHWTTNHETAWSILALTDWAMASGELDADYEYILDLNMETVAEGSFTPANIADDRVLSLPLAKLAPDEVNFLDFQRGLGSGRLYYTAFLDSFVNAEMVGATSQGITIQRLYFDAACDVEVEDCQPIDGIEAGQQVRVELTIIVPNDLLYAMVEDPIPAGTEAIDPGLETTASGLAGTTARTDGTYRMGYWGWWYFNRIEYRDEKVLFLSEFLPAGTYQYTYFLQANIPGEYQVMPATAMQEFFPDVFGRTRGMLFTVVD